MKSTKFMLSGILVLVVMLFASYLVPSFYLRNYTSSKEEATGVTYRKINNSFADSNYNDGDNYNSNGWSTNSYGYGMMGGAGGMMGGNWGSDGNQYTNNTLNKDEANKNMENSLKNAAIDKVRNTITYSGSDINVVVLGGPEQADGKFVIGGLINPTVYIPKNSNVTLRFINEDEGMYHNIAITNSTPPYGYMSMMQGQIYPGGYTRMLPPAANGKFYSESTTFNANYTGEFYYICQYPGHAAKGMYGKIIVN
jgi:rusticyanin